MYAYLTDLHQAKIINYDGHSFSLKVKFLVIKYLLFSRQARIQLAVRVRVGSNTFLSFLADRYLRRFFIELGRNVSIGHYFFLPHPRCVIIAGGVTIGSHVHIGQNVTIGGNFKKTRKLNGEILKLPILQDRIMVSAGAVIGGPVIIHDDVIIGANATVTHDVPPNSICYSHGLLSSKKIEVLNTGGEFRFIDN
jgi:serine O-acetyltransferase